LIAQYSFIPATLQLPDYFNSTLNLRVSSFNYIPPDEDSILDHILKVNLISPTIINNTSPATLTHEITNEELVKEKLNWNFNQSLAIFTQVFINKNLPLLLKKSPKFLFINENTPISLSTNDLKQNDYQKEQYHYVKKSINIPANSALRLEAYLNIVEDLVIEFTAKGEITGNNTSGVLTGSQIATIIQYFPTNLTISEIRQNSVIVQINGQLKTTFGLNNYFNIININSIEYENNNLFDL